MSQKHQINTPARELLGKGPFCQVAPFLMNMRSTFFGSSGIQRKRGLASTPLPSRDLRGVRTRGVDRPHLMGV